ncbi:MAG: cell division protein FtsQ/DivIB [Bacteroidota bacterium]
MIRKIAVIGFYVLLPVGILILLGFAIDNNQSMQCRSFRVNIESDDGMAFVDSAAVVHKVYSMIDTLDQKLMKQIPLNRIEEVINTMYYVESSRVYRTIDGHIVADILQRQPVARVINSMNESYYIDREGKLMRPSRSYTARVPVVTGFINTRYSPNFDINNLRDREELSASEDIIRQLNDLILFIQKDVFLNSWIDQIYVTRAGEFELVPVNGSHTIEIGKVENLEAKFNKLMIFYKNGLTHVGWGSYNRINLKFKNQVVCSK